VFQNVVWGWVIRRLLELGGIGVAIVQLYMAMPPYVQAAIQAVVSGERSQQNLIIAVGGIVVALWGYIWSFRATTVPQAVTTDGQKIVPKPGTAVEKQIDEVAVGVKPASLKPTVFETILGKLFNR
jgi:hypothetical protein